MSIRAPIYRFHNVRNKPENVLHAIGENIKNRRMQLGWTQRQLADHAKVSQTLVSAIERQGEVPNLPMVCRLADALGTTLLALQQEGTF